MARERELAQPGSRHYSIGTKLAAGAAGGALVLATLVATTVPASAEGGAAPTAPRPTAGKIAVTRNTSAAKPSVPQEPVVAGLIVHYDASRVNLSAFTSAAGDASSFSATEDGQGVITFAEVADAKAAEKVAAAVKKLPGVSSVELNLLAFPLAAPPGGVPKDEYFDYQHGVWDQLDSVDYYGQTIKLPKGGYGTKAPALWKLTKGSKKITVAVIDTGSTKHADLDKNTVAGYDMISDSTSARDGNGRDKNPADEGDWDPYYLFNQNQSSWHGTHVAGIIAARKDASGVVGNAPGVRVQHVRVLGWGGGTVKDIADGITWASGGKVKGIKKNKTPAKILNLSLGGAGSCQPETQKAINNARKRGSVVIVAAGNDSQSASNFQPANCKNVITVGATDFLGGRAYYSNYGSAVDLSAPGGDVTWKDSYGQPVGGLLSTLNTGQSSPSSATWAWYQGTSMATPGVAGIAALIASLRPKLSAAQLEKAVKASISKFPNQKALGDLNCQKKKVCGKGIIDATKAGTAWYAKPKISNASVGKTATVSTKVVSPKAKFTYQWLRNGKAIKGATKKSYKVKKSDLGKKLSVKIKAKQSGFSSSSATSSKVKVGKLSPSVSLKLAKTSIKRSAKAKATITVKLGSLSKKPTGKLKVSFGKKSKSYSLKASKKGVLKITLPKLGKGKHKVSVKYTPSKAFKKYVKAKSSKKVTLKVS